jgi:hypothetical protein
MGANERYTGFKLMLLHIGKENVKTLQKTTPEQKNIL